MPIIGSIPPIAAAASRVSLPDYSRLAASAGLAPMSGASAASGLYPAGDAVASSSGAAALDFGAVFEKAVAAVNDKQVAATQATRDVLLGNSDKLHQSMIALQEASVAFSLMVEVRNKVVDGYQELMRMPV
ncbi:flagellar hook-basal body complex protein FliE [Opitutaceae bacterium TAV4]|nr:flagellar hook-basal body complex protein FliE [Opitutaceae bacterium TAV4]RRK02622.1 flagellar hook-basal body complex protein FliE [Opitutaceae bacterium TAV3]